MLMNEMPIVRDRRNFKRFSHLMQFVLRLTSVEWHRTIIDYSSTTLELVFINVEVQPMRNVRVVNWGAKP